MGVEEMAIKGQSMSTVGSFQRSQSDSHTLNFWSPSGAQVHQALGRRVTHIPLAMQNRALSVVGLVLSGPKWRQGKPRPHRARQLQAITLGFVELKAKFSKQKK